MLPAGNLDEVELRAPQDGRNYRPKHVEVIGIINKLLLLHLDGCLYDCISDVRSYKNQSNYQLHRDFIS